MVNCISQDYKDIFKSMLDQHVGDAVISAFLSVVPSCEKVAGMEAIISTLKTEMAPVRKEEAARRMAGRWPAVRYHNEKGEIREVDSPSSLYTELTGKKVSGQVCTEEGTSCRALSIIDNFQLHGFTVMGDGEPPPASPPDAPRGQVERSHQVWKQHLIDKAMHMHIFHPLSPALKDMQEKAGGTPKKAKGT